MANKRQTGWAWVWGLLLALCAGPAFALGLGQIEVRSQRDQPLIAEIQIISSNPAELDALQVRLASPDTFKRIGLEPPQGIVSDLQFAVALDARGRPVIRVTSNAPVRQSLLTFLVEVDWGQGRLVREYSALLDAPRTVSAPAQPPIEAPVAAPSNTIERPAEAPPAQPVATTPEPPEPMPATPVPQAAPPAEETPDPDAVAASPAPTPAAPTPMPATPAPAVSETPAPGNEYGPVKAGDTLGAIAAGLRPEGATLDQTMVALLRANPEAFIGGNLNLVRQGAVLRMPPPAEMSQYGAAEATAVVREQIAQWREMRRPAPQPEAVAETGTSPSATTAAGDTPRVADARLEITPPSPGGAARAGTRSGIEAGGEGEMLRQELQQSKEALAARNAEVEELKARVADLEKLQQQQQQLISLKDSELAAAQQRLAASNKQPAPTLAQATTTPATTPPGSAANAESGSLMWLWIGLALIGAALLAWWLSRRRARPAPPSRVFDTATLAAGMPKAADAQAPRAAEPPVAQPVPEVVPPPVVAKPQPAPPPVPPTAPAAPVWNAPGLQSVEMTPTWHNGKSGRSVADAAASPAPAGQERIELARAYIDLGDTETARTLLQEVADGGDAASRSEASRLLRELA